MNYRLALQSVFFVVEGLLLVLALSAALHFEVARLLFAISVGALCLFAELFVVVRLARRLWKWSGQLATAFVRDGSATGIPSAAAAGNRGEA
ncbi:MAG: hypothetical protein ACRD3N_19980 [Terracidiphilus sp.]